MKKYSFILLLLFAKIAFADFKSGGSKFRVGTIICTVDSLAETHPDSTDIGAFVFQMKDTQLYRYDGKKWVGRRTADYSTTYVSWDSFRKFTRIADSLANILVEEKADKDSVDLALERIVDKDSADAKYYLKTNPNGYISSVDFSPYATKAKVTQDSLYWKGLVDSKQPSGNYLTSYTETDPLFDTKFATKTTSGLTEGTNLYWTNARGDARYPLLSGSYSNPSWITSLPYSKITGSPTIPTTTSQLTNNSGFIIAEVDGSTTNELQSLSIAGQSLSISSGNTITLPTQDLSGLATTGALALKGDSSATGDLKRRFIADSTAKAITLATKLSVETQVISGSGNTISLTGGSSYTIPSQSFSSITSKPTTIAGYGITDYNSLWDTRITTKSTTDLSEGTNKYYTDTRARTAISLTTTGTGAATYNNSTGNINIPLNSLNYDSVQVYTSSGRVNQKLKIWTGKVTPTSGSGAIDISSAGFTTILNVQLQIFANKTAAVDVPLIAGKTYTTTSITYNILVSNNNTIGSLLSPIVGLLIATTITGFEIHCTVTGY